MAPVTLDDGKKPVHRGSKIAHNGDVSPLCAVRPRACDLKVESWCLVDHLVTCPRCLELIAEQKGKTP